MLRSNSAMCPLTEKARQCGQCNRSDLQGLQSVYRHYPIAGQQCQEDACPVVLKYDEGVGS